MATSIDWEAVERDYRLGTLTNTELAAKHNLARETIGRRQKREGWTRDLSEQVRQATRAAIFEQGVTEASQNSRTCDRNAIDAAVELNKRVINGQRTRIGRLDLQLSLLLAEIERITAAKESLVEVGLVPMMGLVKSAGEVNSRLMSDERLAYPTLTDKAPEKDGSIESLLAAMKADIDAGAST